MKKFTHAVVIRFHYPKDSKKFSWRLAYFQAMVLPKLLGQKNKDFDIAIWCEPWHREIIKSLSDRIIVFDIKDEAKGKIKPGYETKAKRFHIDFVGWDNVVGLQKYDIQTAIDSDDMILRDDFIDYIEGQCEWARGSLHLSFQPFMFDVQTLRTYKCPMKYHPKKGSPVYSIYQPNKENYKFAYHDSHLQMWRYLDKSSIISEGFCSFSVHNNNESTYLYKGVKKICL